MIIIEKAILHILDFHSGVTVYSDAELPVKDSVETWLLKHVERAWGSQDAKPGTFCEDSAFLKELQDYESGTLDFVALSKAIAKTLDDALTHAEEMPASDVIIAQASIDEVPYLVILRSNSHIGFTHQVNQTEDGIQNEIINPYSIMPNLSQKTSLRGSYLTSSPTERQARTGTASPSKATYLLPMCSPVCAPCAAASVPVPIVSL